MKEIALLGSTASGKTALSIELAKVTNSIILSLDSLSIYKEIDIASAKPTIEERGDIKHFGIDEIFINQKFDVSSFFNLYKKAKEYAERNNRNLIIVGGTSFYLKALISGLSPKVNISNKKREELKEWLKNLNKAYQFIIQKDLNYANRITFNDKYRIEKWFEIFLETGEIATNYFQKNRQKPIIDKIKIYQIDIDREYLRERIKKRTSLMIENGLVDEVKYLIDKYGTSPNPMKAIGIKETIEYLNNRYDKNELHNLISTHTAQLAKRQRTFNRTQFKNVELLNSEKILKEATKFLS